MVVTVGDTLIPFPVPTKVPPQEPEYHFNTVPDPPAAVKVDELPVQIELGLAEAPVGATVVTSTRTVKLQVAVALLQSFTV